MRGGTLAVAATGMLAASALLAGGGGKIKWGTDYEKGLVEAKMAGKPMMLYFTTAW